MSSLLRHNSFLDIAFAGMKNKCIFLLLVSFKINHHSLFKNEIFGLDQYLLPEELFSDEKVTLPDILNPSFFEKFYCVIFCRLGYDQFFWGVAFFVLT